MKRIYVAGAYSGKGVLEIFKNMQIGIEASRELLTMGCAPFCPWLDFIYFLIPGEKISLNSIYQYSTSWLTVSDAVFVVDNPNNIHSTGLGGEVQEARARGIPVFWDIESLKNWLDEQSDTENREWEDGYETVEG